MYWIYCFFIIFNLFFCDIFFKLPLLSLTVSSLCLISFPLFLPILLLRFLTSGADAARPCALWPIFHWYSNETYPNIPSSLYSSPPLLFHLSWYPSSPPLPPLLPKPQSGSLDSVSSHFKQAWRSPCRQDPGTATSAQGGSYVYLDVCVCEGGSTSASEGWREDMQRYEQMSPGPEQQAGGMPQGKRCSEGPTPAAQPEEGGERRWTESLQTLHLCSPLLSSPCSPASPPAPLLTVQLDN